MKPLALIAAVVLLAFGLGAVNGGDILDRIETAYGQQLGADLELDTGETTRRAVVVDVVDGDTIKIKRGQTEETVRVIGINTPETVHPDKPVECGGPQASRAAKQLLPAGTRVYLVTDPTQGSTDTYGRTLAYVELSDDRDFGAVMLRRGHAREYTYDDAYRRQASYRRLQRGAQHNDVGLWGRC